MNTSNAWPVHPRLRELAALGANWDSYGAKPIDSRCIEHASYLMWIMPQWWTPVPCADGSLQLEMHTGGMDVEMSIRVAA